MMHVLVVAIVLLVWASPALAEQKAPDGFGPIKFGMTKKEAWEAIEGKGRWEDDDTLVHEEGLPEFLKDNYRIVVIAYGGTVSDISIRRKTGKDGNKALCMTELKLILKAIKEKYNTIPISLVDEITYPIPETRFHFLFYFMNRAAIFVNVIAVGELEATKFGGKSSCTVAVSYFSPGKEEDNPF